MEIKVNNQSKDLPTECSVQQLVEQVVSDKQKGIAVAVNNQVIKKDEWHNALLKQNDEVIIIKATQGG